MTASELLSSPRTNLNRLLAREVPEGALLSAGEDGRAEAEASAAAQLLPLDAENKLHNHRLYLVLDLDETLVYSQRMPDPTAPPAGTQIWVRGQPFDMVIRPGLQHFLQMVASKYIVFLYTMGDADYTQACLRVIDPDNKYFRGAAPSEHV